MSGALAKVAESYGRGRRSMIAYAAQRRKVYADAEDAVQDAALLAVERALEGKRTWWRVAIKHAIGIGVQRDQRLSIGLPLSLSDASNLAATVDARIRLARAQRVLSRSELDLLLSEYDGDNSRIRIKVRQSQRKARDAIQRHDL